MQSPRRRQRPPRRNRLMKEADLAIRLAHLRDRRRVGNTGGVLIAEELDVAASGIAENLPAGAVANVAADQFGAKANGKHQDPDSACAGDQEIAEFMEEHDNRKTNKNGRYTRQNRRPKC